MINGNNKLSTIPKSIKRNTKLIQSRATRTSEKIEVDQVPWKSEHELNQLNEWTIGHGVQCTVTCHMILIILISFDHGGQSRESKSFSFFQRVVYWELFGEFSKCLANND